MEQNGLRRIYLVELLDRINRIDPRSAITWCKKNDVDIYEDSSGKFVVQAEFDFAYSRPVINKYKQKYGQEWRAIFDLCKENNLIETEREEEVISKVAYIPKSKGGRKFLDKF